MVVTQEPRRGSLSSRLRLAFILLGLTAIGLTGFQSYQIAYRALEEASYERLTGIRESKKRQIESYFRDTTRILETLAADESVIDSLLGFRAGWLQLETTSVHPQSFEALWADYRNRIAPILRVSEGDDPDIDGLAPRSTAGRLLQLRYRVGEVDAMGDDYAAVHRLHHASLLHFTETFGFDDLLLIDAAGREIVYSVAKGLDLGVSLEQPGYSDSSLAAAVARSLEPGAGTVVVDFARYPGALGTPVLFAVCSIAAPTGERGVLAARLSVDKLDEVMTGGGAWRDEGLGESGETYLVGPDLMMRSDSRFLLEDPAGYQLQLRALSYDEAVLRRMSRDGSSILNQRVETSAASSALSGEKSTRRIADYRGVEVLSSFTPLDLPGLDWVLMSEIDVEEAFREVRALRLRLGVLALIVSGAFAAVGYVIARGATRPLVALTAEVERLGSEGRIEAKSAAAFRDAPDEVARLWQTFEDLTERLSATLVSRDHLDSLLASMINAVFVLGNVDRGEGGGPIIRSANPAACRLLGYDEERINGLPLRDIVGSGSDDPPWMENLRRDGTLPAIEKELVSSDGRRIPVLFTAAYIADAHGGLHEAVCVAQDITPWKAAEERLQESRQQLRVLAGRLLSAQEEERSRLARELHDDVTQRLAMLAIDAGKLARADGLDPGQTARLEGLKERIVVLSHDVQGLSRRLHPSILDDLGLTAALRAECSSLSTRLEIPVSFAAEDMPESFPRESAIALYRVAQECLRNIGSHAEASEVNVEVGVVQDKVRLTIEDDGNGFDPEETRRRQGLGLASMDERVRLIGGSMAVRTAPGQGVKITVEAPLEH